MTHAYEPCTHPGRHGYTLPGEPEYEFCERCRRGRYIPDHRDEGDEPAPHRKSLLTYSPAQERIDRIWLESHMSEAHGDERSARVLQSRTDLQLGYEHALAHLSDEDRRHITTRGR